MMIPSDETYKLTRSIKQGKSGMPVNLEPLAKWIEIQYEVKPLNIVYDIVNAGETPRLQICFEYTSEEAKFLNQNRSMNLRKQKAIVSEFTRLAIASELNYSIDDVCVIYGAFESIAKTEAMGKISQEQLNALQQSLDDKNLWLIITPPAGIRPGFFLYTNEQVKKYKSGKIVQQWSNQFYLLLKQFDEFNYIRQTDISIFLDSKENFEHTYQSNWYYYFK